MVVGSRVTGGSVETFDPPNRSPIRPSRCAQLGFFLHHSPLTLAQTTSLVPTIILVPPGQSELQGPTCSR